MTATHVSTQPLDHAAARALAGSAFCCTARRHRIGLELEWHVYDPTDPTRRLTPAFVQRAADEGGPLAEGVTTSPEPGGQIELDTPPLPLGEVVPLAQRASAELHRRFAAADLTAVAVGTDPHRIPENLLRVPRYDAMAATFTHRGPEGLRMMANTAAMQINLDLDPEHDRWRLAHHLGPVLVAAFANSPVGPGHPTEATGWASNRLRTWWAIDPTRTRPVDHDGDPVDAWLRYATSAQVLLIRRDGGATAINEPLSFGEWLHDGHPLGPPTVDDFAYHLSTLFPPVRPRGYLEFRFLDALDEPDWCVATAIVAAAFADRHRAEAIEATESVIDRWMDGARLGLADPDLAAAAEQLADLTERHLAETAADPGLRDTVSEWRTGPLAERRTPADAMLERWRTTGTVLPPPILAGASR